ncbi:MAG TPA: replicative DNA helicase [Micromonosporaceae bacterium]|nr:replicative DNA helicase [Micromonosporaceae bacterium]
MTDMIEQVPQHDVGAEQIVLGALMLTDKTFADVEHLLTADAFYRPAHSLIYTALLELRDRGEPTDPVALGAYLAATGGLLSKVGGSPYLHTCYQSVPTVLAAGHYAKIVAGCAALREVARVARQVESLAATARYDDADSVLDRAREWLAKIGVVGGTNPARLWRDVVPGVLEAVEQAAQIDDGPPGVPTGLHDVDDLIGGLRPGQVIIVAARPGVGKSVLLINMATHAAIRLKLRAVLFTLEMSEVEVGLRVASAHAGIPLANLRSGRLDELEWSKLIRFAAEADDAPLHIDETSRVTLAHIRSVMRRITAEHGHIDLVLVDYLQLAESAGRESRQEQVAALSRGLKLLAKEFAVPVVAASQLNRNPETRSSKRPQASDLRESGALEQDSDVIILLHREDVHDHESPRAGECDLIVDKNRHGRMDTITVAAQLHLSRFVSMAAL